MPAGVDLRALILIKVDQVSNIAPVLKSIRDRKNIVDARAITGDNWDIYVIVDRKGMDMIKRVAFAIYQNDDRITVANVAVDIGL